MHFSTTASILALACPVLLGHCRCTFSGSWYKEAPPFPSPPKKPRCHLLLAANAALALLAVSFDRLLGWCYFFRQMNHENKLESTAKVFTLPILYNLEFFLIRYQCKNNVYPLKLLSLKKNTHKK